MKRARILLCCAYGVLAIAALVITWSLNIPFLKANPSAGFAGFWAQLRANLVTRSISVDLLFFLSAAALFMISEARRLKMRFVWLYLLLGYLVDISFAFPVFMIARERAMARAGEGDGRLAPSDLFVAAVLAGVMLWTGWVVLR